MDCPPLWLWGCQATAATLPSITRGGERSPDLSWKAQSFVIIIQGTKRACLTLGSWPGRQAFSTWGASVHCVVKTTSLHCPYPQFGSIWFLTLLVRTTFYKVVFPSPVLSLSNTGHLLPCFVPSMVSILDSTTWSCFLFKKLNRVLCLFFILPIFCTNTRPDLNTTFVLERSKYWGKMDKTSLDLLPYSRVFSAGPLRPSSSFLPMNLLNCLTAHFWLYLLPPLPVLTSFWSIFKHSAFLAHFRCLF